MLTRAAHSVTGTEAVGPYTVLRIQRGDLDPGLPGQFFMLEAPGRLLPRPMSLCLVTESELAFLIDPPPAVLGFRTSWHAEAAALVPNAEVVLEPTYVTEVMPAGHDVLACGPAPMLEAIRALTPHAQLAWEAPMACGYGACWGCAVRIDGELKRLCVEGPVLDAAA